MLGMFVYFPVLKFAGLVNGGNESIGMGRIRRGGGQEVYSETGWYSAKKLILKLNKMRVILLLLNAMRKISKL